jgi:hypothetical protein
MEKAVVIGANSVICSVAGWLAWSGWEEGAFEVTVLAGAAIAVGLGAIYQTIRGRPRP